MTQNDLDLLVEDLVERAKVAATATPGSEGQAAHERLEDARIALIAAVNGDRADARMVLTMCSQVLLVVAGLKLPPGYNDEVPKLAGAACKSIQRYTVASGLLEVPPRDGEDCAACVIHGVAHAGPCARRSVPVEPTAAPVEVKVDCRNCKHARRYSAGGGIGCVKAVGAWINPLGYNDPCAQFEVNDRTKGGA